MQLRCGGMFSNHFIANSPQNLPVKKSENRSIIILATIWDKSLRLTFLDHPVCVHLLRFLYTPATL